jgi:hypothetical protein
MAGRMHIEHRMSLRIRHCVECPKCHICYLIAFSPYRNRAYLVHSGEGSSEEYTLYCFCEGAQMPNRWRWRQVKVCEVSKVAHDRGYGTLDEICPTARQSHPSPGSTLASTSI